MTLFANALGILMFLSIPAWAATQNAQIVYVTKMVKGKKTWVADETSVKAGTNVTAIVVNKLAEPHGFEIPGVVKPQVIPANGHKILKFKTVAAKTLQVKCHLHPAHVGTALTVKPPKKST